MHSKFGHRVQPMFNYGAKLPGFLPPMRPPYDLYGLGWEVQKPSGEIYNIQYDKRSEK